MKIAIFTDSFLPGVGGTENAIKFLAEEISKTDEVVVCAPSYSKTEKDQAFDFKVFRTRSLKISSKEYWAMPGVSFEFKKKLEEFKPDVVHCHTMGMMAGYACKYAKKHNIPIVFTIHTKFFDCYKSYVKLNCIANILWKHALTRAKKGDRICTVSHYMADYLQQNGLKKDITVIKNGGFYHPCELKKEKNKEFIFLYVGLIIDYKNIGFTIKALEILKQRRNDFKFIVIGRGPHVKKFKKQAQAAGLGDNVVFNVEIKNKNELQKYYAEADLFLFPSLFDTDGLVVLEAANAKTPSLVLKNSGPGERIIDNQTGFLSDNDEKAFAERINQIISDEELLTKVGENAHNIITTWSDNAAKYIETYIEEIAKKQQKN